MKKRTKLYLSGAAGLFAVVALTSCTKSFCSNEDTGRMLYAFDPGITAYVAGTDALAPITSDDGIPLPLTSAITRHSLFGKM